MEKEKLLIKSKEKEVSSAKKKLNDDNDEYYNKEIKQHYQI